MQSPSSAPQRVAIFGAGIAGLTVAHELARRGHEVTVYEPNEHVGGFFRSARRECDGNMPSEYSWHGFGPWYNNAFEIMREIPFDDQHSLFERALSRPIDFGLAGQGKQGQGRFDDTRLLNIRGMFRMTWLDVLLGSWIMLKTWVADDRSREHYANLNAAEAWRPWLSNQCWRYWRSSFGPWIGSDWLNASLHTAGQFFGKQLLSSYTHHHEADCDGPAWRHSARGGWLLMRGPSSEFWFDHWVRYLKSLGVRFVFQASLTRLTYNGEVCTGAVLDSGERVEADCYVVAANPFAVAEVLHRTPQLERLDQLNLFAPLVEQGPHVQVSLRLGFAERITWPRKRAAVIVASSEYDLTLFAQEQAWDESVALGDGIQSLWTITACVSQIPGRVHGRTLEQCTKDEFIDEVLAQLRACDGLNAMLAEANEGRCFRDFSPRRIEVWHEWTFNRAGLQGRQPKWVNRTGNQAFLPTQETPVPNLILAGAHTKTEVDVWSIEAAVESGRRAAQVLEPSVRVAPQCFPSWFKALRQVDNWLYAHGAPNLVDVALLGGCGLALGYIACRMLSTSAKSSLPREHLSFPGCR